MSTQIQGKSKQIQNDNLEQEVTNSNQKTSRELEPGISVLTMDGGKLYPIMFKEILAGETIESYDLNMITRILTPLVPSFDRMYITAKAFFVPHTRVMENFEKIMADKLAANWSGTRELPIMTMTPQYKEKITFRDTLAARYGDQNKSSSTTINMLLLRGYRAIVNDYIINKEYETPKVEWKNQIPVLAEREAMYSYNSTTNAPYPNNYIIEAAQTRKGYLTNIKKNIENLTEPDLDTTTEDGSNGTTLAWNRKTPHLDWQTRFMQEKQNIANANKTDWEIIADMGGTEPVKADRVEFLGEIDYEMNYQQITQSAPQIDNSSPLGTTGAFSFTKATGNLFKYKKFKQHGFVHVLVSVTIDKNYIAGTPKELIKQTIDDIYRPAAAKKEAQLLLQKEVVNNISSVDFRTVAFQPAWAEYKRMPKLVSGDMRETLLDPYGSGVQVPSVSQWHNFQSPLSYSGTIDGRYFRPSEDIRGVIERNNIFLSDDENYGQLQQPIMSMSEHKVKTSLPIVDNTIKSVSKAEQTR